MAKNNQDLNSNPENNLESSRNNYTEDNPEVERQLSAVASNPKQNFIILGLVAVIFAYLFYVYFLSSDEADKPKKVPVPTSLDNPVEVDNSDSIQSIPTLPSPPQLEDPSLPLPPLENDKPKNLELPKPIEVKPDQKIDNTALPPLPKPQQPSTDLLAPPSDITPSLPNTTTEDNQEKARIEQKRKSAIVLIAGKPNAKTPEQIQQESDFKYRGNMNLILARGKLLDAAIETAINSEVGGEIRAVITRDVYSEWGKNILIPKGSKIFGSYAKAVDGVYGRVAIAWDRIDLINGYSINFSGNAADDLGRQSIKGRLDNKFKEKFSHAVLLSVFNVQLARTVDNLVKPASNSSTAATLSSQASSIRNIANSTTATTNPQAVAAMASICAQVLNTITDKSSTTFTSIQNTCNSLPSLPGSTDLDRLSALKNSINSAADSLIQNSTQASEPTKAQKSAETAFNDIGDIVKKMIEDMKFQPTVTLDQGARIKIYVNRDYLFPAVAVSKARNVH